MHAASCVCVCVCGPDVIRHVKARQHRLVLTHITHIYTHQRPNRAAESTKNSEVKKIAYVIELD